MSVLGIQRRQIRGRILRALDTIYPKDLNLSTIVLVLEDRHMPATAADVRQDLAYLDEKGYVELLEQQDDGEEVLLARLTAKGKDLLEKNIPEDPGVELE
jgi:hypothetical protein